jgi:hypothetical protein
LETALVEAELVGGDKQAAERLGEAP